MSNINYLNMIPKHQIKDLLWSYLNKQVSAKGFSIKTKEDIYDDLKAEGVSKQEIKDKLEELERDGSITKREVHFELFVPTDKLKLIPKDIKKYFVPPIISKLIFGAALLTLIMNIPPINSFLQKFILRDLKTSIPTIVLFGTIAAFYLSDVSLKILFKSFEKIRLAKQYSEVIIPILTILALSSIFYFLVLLIAKKQLEIGHILVLLGFSITGGIAYYGIKLKKVNNPQS